MIPKKKFVLCPRCELNYFNQAETDAKYCKVCLAELGAIPSDVLLPDEEIDQILCPRCRVNIINADEEMCSECREKEANKKFDEFVPDIIDEIDATGSDMEVPIDEDDNTVSLEGMIDDEQEELEEDSYDDTESDDFEEINLDDVPYDDDDEDDDAESDDEEVEIKEKKAKKKEKPKKKK